MQSIKFLIFFWSLFKNISHDYCVHCTLKNRLLHFFELIDTHKPRVCLNYKTLRDTTPIVSHCDTVHGWNIKDHPIFNPDKLENLMWFTSPRGPGCANCMLSFMDTTFTFIWCHTLHGCLRQSDKHCVTRAWLRNNKREWGRVPTPLQIGCALLKKYSVSRGRATCAAGRELSGTQYQV